MKAGTAEIPGGLAIRDYSFAILRFSSFPVCDDIEEWLPREKS